MALLFRNILCPVDFDDSSMDALQLAADIASQNNSTVLVLHAVSRIVAPARLTGYFDLYKSQEETARTKLAQIAHRRLAGLKYELLTQMGDPAAIILMAERRAGADLIVMATHGRRGVSRLFLGSVAEQVLRQSTCPVLTVHYALPQKDLVSGWMTRNPVTAAPDEKLSSVHGKVLLGGFHCIPIIKEGVPVGIVTDHDIHAHTGHLGQTEAAKVMNEALITVSPSTTIREAARLLRERRIGALPVVEDGKLAGVITTTDVLNALIAEDEPASSRT
jgi:nucleotide-binding universal stress UspA family protein